MLPHVKVLYHSIANGIDNALVLVRDAGRRKVLSHETYLLAYDLGLSTRHIVRPDASHLETIDGLRVSFYSGDPDNLCGVRGEVVFVYRHEWTDEEIDQEVKPFLAGTGHLRVKHRFEDTLIARGLMTNDDRWCPARRIEDLLVDLDLCLNPPLPTLTPAD